MKKNILLMAALLIASATVFTACSSSDDNIISENQQPAVMTGKYTMTVEASKGDGASTRALSLSGSTLNATWAAGEKVSVYNVTKGTDLGGELEAQSDGASTTLKGTLTGTIENGDNLTLKFLSPNYTSQSGTIDYIAANCDYATASVTAKVVGDDVSTTADAAFSNMQAIVKFTLKDKGNSDAAINATQLVVSDGTNSYTVTPTSATSELYVALPDISSKTLTLTATDGTYHYAYEKSGVTFANGQYYEITVKMTAAPVADLLDVQFNINGSAVDLSTKSKTVTRCGSTSYVYYSETYQRNVARFSHTWGGDATGYYKVDFESDQAFRNALANGHSLEVLCMANYDGAIPNTEVKPFSAMQGGGTGFLVTKTSDDRQNELCFLPNTSTDGTSTWRWTNCGIVPQKGVFYHIVGVWDKTNSKSYIYVNGELKKVQDAPGNLNFAQTGCNWFCIGGDPNDANTANSAWQGDVAIARVYDKPLTADEAKALWLIDGK